MSGEGKGATSVLRNVAGRVDIDRSLHQDRYIPAPGVAGPSRYAPHQKNAQAPARTANNAFDLGSLRDHLAPVRPVQHENWANTFVPPSHQPARQQSIEQRSSSPWQQDFIQHNQARQDIRPTHQPEVAPWQVPNQYRPQFMPARPQYFQPPPPPPQQYMHAMHTNQDFAPESFEYPTQIEAPAKSVEETRPAQPLSEPQELLARTARDLVNDLDASSEILRDNPKLAQSQFMQLLRGLGNEEVVVEDGKATVNGEEIGEGAKFVSRGGDWASAFVEERPAQRDGEVHLASTLPALNGEPVFEERMRYANGALYPDQNAIIQPTETSQRPENQRRKSVHFDDNEAYESLGSGVPNNLEEAMRASTSIPGMSSAWQDDGLDLDDFDETSFMNYSGQLRQGTDATVGAGQRENWGGLQEDWEKFQQADPRIKAMGQMDRYLFQSRNPYGTMGDDADMGRESPTMKGVLELEAAVQHDPSDHEAWYALGLKQQENEREDQAIRALAKVIDLDPDYRPAYLALAVSYTNEAAYEKARVMLGKWIDMAHGSGMSESETDNVQAHEGLVERLIDMARRSPEEVDPDVQIALGVLFNSSEEYAKAEDCFLAALSVRPDDWLLYNRLGATLANSGRSNEAISYYHKALSLHPSFVRALFNLGISYINLAQYPLAAQHIISAIRLQHTDATEAYISGTVGTSAKGVTSDALWNSLRTACLHMGRHDLVELAARKDVTAFPDTFDSPVAKDKSPPFNLLPYESGDI